ncbi:UDP:flavonoid glycosyltransferase YjiC, YdhE family [Thermomonospora echinospora]|uniref:UDP:flavonoid glycosyltransferase YjiC, YdhE family n=1 Tax=Thermomonospora echinospora TaxID=1992 RepID=A0A1H6CD22_9ACTN|nr:glycosyltransferase [Thermomonospora echinospora]SEG70762.1 UDP:flavonoid glycosyltransferase YjiC, YdhE family [Thermomonospora echinospora]
MQQTIVLFALGSRGDIQPCVALGQGLAARGASVRVIAAARYANLIAAAGLDPAPLSVDPADLLNTEEGQELLAGGRNPVRFLRGMKRVLGPLAERLLAEIRTAARGADLVLAPSAGWLGEHLGEHLGIPSAVVHYQPSHPTRAFPHPLVPQARRLGPWGNRLSFQAVDLIAWLLAGRFINPWRRAELGLPKASALGLMRRVYRERPALCCFSPTVVPRPRDWPSNVHLTGYWFLDEPDYRPSDELVAFLEAGPPPVYVGFGSMVPAEPEATDRLVRAAIRMAGVRAVIMGDPKNTPVSSDEDIMVVEDVPHSWLFPRMAAVVHHGGAGTTAAGLRAGVPTVVCPFFGDQPYWGERVAALRAGPAPIPFRTLSVRTLAEAIRQSMHDPTLQLGAKNTGHRLSQENGTAMACDVIESLLTRRS